MFKLTLSAEQFAELLHMDAEVEEGEEGGVRVEFEPGGKGVGRPHPFLTSFLIDAHLLFFTLQSAYRSIFISARPASYLLLHLDQALRG